MKRSLWDRFKILFLLAGTILCLAMGKAGQEFIPFGVALTETLRSAWWIGALMFVEGARQLYYAFVDASPKMQARIEAREKARSMRVKRMSDWTRFRWARYLRWGFMLFLIDWTVASMMHVSLLQGLFLLPGLIIQALPIVLQLVAVLAIAVLQFVAIFGFMARGGVETYYPGDVNTRFKDVWGQDAVLDRVRENLVFLQNPEAIEAKGGHVPGGILLWGPPGTGKTLMAEAMAGEAGVPYVFVDPGAFTSMFMGVGVLKVRGLFKKLRKLAVKFGGVVVFFDEADSLGNRGKGVSGGPGGWGRMVGCHGHSFLSNEGRSAAFGADEAPDSDKPTRNFVMVGGMGSGGQGTLQALLAEISGLKKPRGILNRYGRRALGMRPKPPPHYRILLLMASNMPESLDDALLRPGRLDRIYKVGYPSFAGRVRTYQGYFSKIAHSLTDEQIAKLATMTPYATGATIKDVVNESLINALRNGRESATWDDVIKAKHLKDLGPPEDTEYVQRERHAIAIHEACHAVVAHRFRTNLTIDIATIEKGGTYLGMVASIKPEDTFTAWKSDYEADIMVALASLAGERLFFGGDNTSGVSGDLQQATKVGAYMEGYWGMGESLSVHGTLKEQGIGPGGLPREKGEQVDPALGQKIEATLRRLYERTEVALQEDRDAVLRLAHALERYKTLSGDDVRAVIEMEEGPLVDGRAYLHKALELEEYHEASLEARRARTEAVLPELA